MKVDKKSGLITGAATVLVGGGVALGLILSGNSSNSPTPAPVKVADVTAAPVSSAAASVSPSNVGVKPAANNVAPIQQPKVEEPVTEPTSEAPAPDPTTADPEPSVIQASGAGVVGDDGQTRPALPPGPIAGPPPMKAAPNLPPPSPSSS